MADALSEFFTPVVDTNLPKYSDISAEGFVGQNEGILANDVKSYYNNQPVGDNGTGEASVSQYMSEHPGASYEEIMAYMASQSDEWAEKYLDYLTEKGELDRANEYTASREDTAYQRLVSDLKAAGLNPAMMFGSSASISASGSQGYIKMTEGANSRSISNYSKLKNLLLALAKFEFDKSYKTANTVIKGIGEAADIVTSIIKAFV